jgi:hypothetical protein
MWNCYWPYGVESTIIPDTSNIAPCLVVISDVEALSPPRFSGAAQNQPVHTAANVTQIGLIAFLQFCHGAAGIPDFRES